MSTEQTLTTTTIERLVGVLNDVLGDDHSGGTFTEETLLFGSLRELDSLALVALIMAIEDRFGFDIDEEDITPDVFESVGSLVAYIEAHLS